jgi:hypothetical protein
LDKVSYPCTQCRNPHYDGLCECDGWGELEKQEAKQQYEHLFTTAKGKCSQCQTPWNRGICSCKQWGEAEKTRRDQHRKFWELQLKKQEPPKV